MPSKTSPKKMEVAWLRNEAVRLRREGASCGQIADHLQISRSRAHQLICEVLETLEGESITEGRQLRALEAERLDALQHGLWEAAVGGDMMAVDRVLRIMERRAKLLGLDSPAKYSATDPSGEEAVSGVVLVPAEMTLNQWVAEFGESAPELDTPELDSTPEPEPEN
ncbi:TetR family transcriptional regulator C-terminal domain-containing protein [Ectothiorhodospira variabilis]|uniref:TetR family transcriptional regulator C-terminal domain-containing protein n=1 Tax=Ectothiorhodospira variabilis TaxID=505694 RepID=UPI001EFA9E56|nr:TetR family transcriptional regulator C-terminal domain-containing protein [Ectothiorhodospira variabilis]MCG5495636.1 TetR family transcriptional regulator C-terminal domain-containing protein [Ectothiorhodospira variabilis]MCG5504697.1 TetR family transcriptional regulator C-terminal domain-containing protein [Ectothiorhodospira variabilis]MCG5507854.1 TetR family transcriptional regulator C-terminal domain-containing protein [Ectothiorhodospira variabilis]